MSDGLARPDLADAVFKMALYGPPVTVAWSAPPRQAETPTTILRGQMDRRRMRARQYAVLLAHQHATDLETLSKSISPHDVEIIAGLAVDAYVRRAGVGR